MSQSSFGEALSRLRRRGDARIAGLRKATGFDLVNHPDLVNDPKRFLECGVADFVLCGCLPFAKADDVLNVTRLLNGGNAALASLLTALANYGLLTDSSTPRGGGPPRSGPHHED